MAPRQGEKGGRMEKTTHTVRCPACGQTVKAVAYDGKVQGWCAVKGRLVTLQVK